MDAVAEITAALTGLSGSLPRRAVVLPDGSLGDRAVHTSLPEVPIMSLACEVLRKHRGVPVYSRDTAALVQQCLGHNEHGAWEAVLQDILSGDFDFDRAAAVIDGSDKTVAGCLVSAAPGQHAWSVVKASRCLLAVASDYTMRRTAAAFHQLFGEIVAVLARAGRDVSADERAACVTSLGKLIVWCNLSVPTLCDMLATCLAQKPDDLLRLFLFAPVPAIFEFAPTLVDTLVQRLDHAPQASKYPSCALLALAPSSLLVAHAPVLLKSVQRMLDTAAAQKHMDPKLALACAALAKSLTTPRSLDAALAHGLMCMSAALVSKHQRM